MASSRTFISWTWPGLRWEFQPQLNELIHLSPFPNVCIWDLAKVVDSSRKKSSAKTIIPETQNRNHVEDLNAEKVHHLRTSFVGRSWLWWVWHYLVLLFGIDCASSSLPRRSSRRKWTAQCHRVRMGWHGRSWQAMVDSAKKTTFKDDIVPVFVTVGKVWSYAHCSRSTEKMRPWCSKCIQMQVAFEGLVTGFCSLACWFSSWGARCLCHFGHWESPHGGSCILDVTSSGSLAVYCPLRGFKGWCFCQNPGRLT